MNKGIGYAPPYEDLPSSDVFLAHKPKETLGKRPKATAWFQDFKVLAPFAVINQAAVVSRLGYRALHTVVRRRNNRRP